MGNENLGDIVQQGGTTLTLAETTTPSSVENFGKVYTKSDSGLYFQDGAGLERPASNAVRALANTFVSGSGVAGSDNTAQTVKTVVVPANTLIAVNCRLRVRVYWRGDTGGAVTCTVTVNGVTIATSTDVGGASFFATESWLHYIDQTHANIIENGTYPATGSASAFNVAGFDWEAAQDVDADQNQVAGNHIVVAAIFLDILPIGLA